VPNGSTITFSYSTPAAGVISTNWIGLYSAGQTPGQVASTTWQYAPGSGGTLTFSSASLNGVGKYTAFYLYNNGYQVLAGPVSFSVVPSRPAPAPAFSRSFGGFGPGVLADPFGVALDQHGNVWVADRGGDRDAGGVAEFSPGGRLVTAFGGHGRSALNHPSGIAVGPDGNIWVTDTGADQVVEFSPQGRQLTAFGSSGSGNGQLNDPQDLVVAPDGDVYVADQGNNRIEEFSPSGGYLASISVATPDGVALDAAGDIWVSSPSYADGNAVYEFSPAGTQLQTFGATQASYGAMSNVGGIAVGPGGRIYLAQPDYGWVTVYNPDGSFYTEFGLQSDTRQAGEDLEFPQGLAVTAGGDVFVADSGNGRVAEFAPPGSGRRAAAVVPPSGSGVPRDVWLALVAAALLALAGLGLWLRRRGNGRVPTPAPVPPAPARPALPALRGPAVSRRQILSGATALGGISLGAAALPLSLRRAMSASLTGSAPGGIRDIQHIVILMQENRSFDHYFGTMPGVRGYADPTAIKLPNGNPVFYQPDPSHAQGYLSPFYYDPSKTSAQATPGTDHSWPTQHQAWDNGLMDQWVAAKGPYTMGYFKQPDIEFHWALAEAFTICDNYHCSVLGPTNPNRLYMWTGMIDPNGTGGGPIIDTAPRTTTSSCPGGPTPSYSSGRASAGASTRRKTTTTTTRWPGSSSSATRRPLPRSTSGAWSSSPPGRSRTTPSMTGCRRCPGSSRPPRRPSTRTTSPRPERSTSHRSWTRSRRARTCGLRPRSSSATTRTTACSTMCRRPPPRPGPRMSSSRASRSAWASGPRRRSCRPGRPAGSPPRRCSITPR